MSRSGTTNLNIGTWVQGEKPGAGPQGSDSDGLNGNAYKIDVALGVGHTAAGAHKANAITATALAAGCVDGSSIQGAAGSAIAIKTYATGSDGVQKTHLNPNVADGSTIEKDASVGLRIKDAGVTGAKLASGVADGTTLEVASSSLRIKDDGVTAPKISHDNTRTKVVFTFGYDYAATKIYCNGVEVNNTIGIVMPRAGAITKFCACDSTGFVAVTSKTYSTFLATFSVNDKLSLAILSGSWSPIINGSEVSSDFRISKGSYNYILTVEVEFDD